MSNFDERAQKNSPKPRKSHKSRKKHSGQRLPRVEKAGESTCLLMATTLNSFFILLLYVLSIFKII